MKISSVHCFKLAGRGQLGTNEERQAQMLDIYPEYARRGPVRRTIGEAISAAYVQVETDEGVSGLFGPIFEEQAPLIKSKLAPVLLGRDPLAYELLWDLMYRQDRHARKGYQMMAISAVDCALWDLRGKIFNLPVYRLLGGPTRERVDCYASMLGHSLEPGLVQQRAQEMVRRGFKAQKWFFRYGPTDGLEGMERNVALVRTAREAVGPNVELMFDAFMGWDATYTIRLIERIAEYRPRWVEEAVPMDRVEDFARIRRSTNVPIATGEHEYTRWGFQTLLQADALDVIQADPDWCGGISELVKICALASTYGRPVFPHGHSIFSAWNVIASQPPSVCPMLEFLLRAQPHAQHFHRDYVEPEEGSLALPVKPGLGIEIDDGKVESRVAL